ncbi:GyrI-like small molecule binding protein [Pseudonocardia sediminis]|uniref:GyrI-like small molecule binding protein n=1 Tax=Pseudonocardia sediminis TaxID=1397368 RepID=A0A4Q7UQD6_PSEST|nr:GyrI-like domain-containing protein [Pseudonocardia sediminis]RZT83264.1 GyrI-like small molecule binding protein [Pseudonocardia sediminis]
MQTFPTPQIVERTEQSYVGVTRTVTMTTMGEIADRIPVLIGRLAELGVAPAGAPFLRYLLIDMDRSLTVEAGVPVLGPAPRDELWQTRVIPAGRYATLTHTGHPDELIAVTDGLLAWGEEHGHRWDVERRPDGDRWGCRLEAFHSNPMEVSIDAWVTELTFRLAD